MSKPIYINNISFNFNKNLNKYFIFINYIYSCYYAEILYLQKYPPCILTELVTQQADKTWTAVPGEKSKAKVQRTVLKYRCGTKFSVHTAGPSGRQRVWKLKTQNILRTRRCANPNGKFEALHVPRLPTRGKLVPSSASCLGAVYSKGGAEKEGKSPSSQNGSS